MLLYNLGIFPPSHRLASFNKPFMLEMWFCELKNQINKEQISVVHMSFHELRVTKGLWNSGLFLSSKISVSSSQSHGYFFFFFTQKSEENSASEKSYSLNASTGRWNMWAFTFLFVSLGKEMKLLSEKDHSSVLHLSHSAEPWT